MYSTLDHRFHYLLALPGRADGDVVGSFPEIDCGMTLQI